MDGGGLAAQCVQGRPSRSSWWNRKRSAPSVSAKRPFPALSRSTARSASTRPNSSAPPRPPSSSGSSSSTGAARATAISIRSATYGKDFDSLPLEQYWIKLWLQGKAPSLDDIWPRQHGRRARPLQPSQQAQSAQPFGRWDYAFHFDAGLYAAHLRRWAEAHRRRAPRRAHRRRRRRTARTATSARSSSPTGASCPPTCSSIARDFADC